MGGDMTGVDDESAPELIANDDWGIEQGVKGGQTNTDSGPPTEAEGWSDQTGGEAPVETDGSPTPEPAAFESPKLTIHLPSERVTHFDRHVAAMAELAAGLDVNDFEADLHDFVSQLGDVAANRLIMANVEDGVAEMPPSAYEQDGFTVIPLLPGEDNIVLGPSIFRVSPFAVDATAQRYDISKEAAQRAGETIHEHAKERPPLRVASGWSGITTSWVRWVPLGEDRGFGRMNSRPTLVVAPSISPSALAHELTHAGDFEEWSWRRHPKDVRLQELYDCWTEMRGYHVAAVAGRGTTASSNSLAEHLEAMRLTNNANSDPFDPTTMVEVYKGHGLLRGRKFLVKD